MGKVEFIHILPEFLHVNGSEHTTQLKDIVKDRMNSSSPQSLSFESVWFLLCFCNCFSTSLIKNYVIASAHLLEEWNKFSPTSFEDEVTEAVDLCASEQTGQHLKMCQMLSKFLQPDCSKKLLIRRDIFLFRFGSKNSCNRIMKTGAWAFDKSILARSLETSQHDKVVRFGI